MPPSQKEQIAWILVFLFIQVKNPIFARVGESADLPCTYSTSATQGFTLEWRYAAPGTPAIQAEKLLYFDGRLYWVGSSESRMSLAQDPPVKGTATLRISNLLPSDTGLYICDITNPNDWSGSGQGLINLTVLIPPSVPVCGLNGQFYAGNDVTLTCQSSHGVPAPIYSWSREKNAAPLSPGNMMEDQRSGSLLLRNLSAPLSGIYTCRASNDLGYALCAVTVRVTYRGVAAITGVAVMGAFIAILLLAAVLAYFLWYRRRKPKRAEGRNELSEEEAPPSFRPSRHAPEDSLLPSPVDGGGTSRPGQPGLRPAQQQSFVV
ncbi:hypothetical protein AAFF_G00365390 [Aldrovandia affinis]|uniref:Ig-like domain-containing protein n=1 Tax=Aldrovandia affinis TaxID=143900 RepID=A0AAD7R546_9TELE|nr:hypothetical protein AAFF_G00365390 [Aldrovandia affinis]